MQWGYNTQGGYGAAPIKRLNSRRVYAADDVEALPPKDVFPLTVDQLNQKFLHEDHPRVLVDIPCRSNVCLNVF